MNQSDVIQVQFIPIFKQRISFSFNYKVQLKASVPIQFKDTLLQTNFEPTNNLHFALLKALFEC